VARKIGAQLVGELLLGCAVCALLLDLDERRHLRRDPISFVDEVKHDWSHEAAQQRYAKIGLVEILAIGRRNVGELVVV